jgi:diguanylate cyclase (GGDEF)-like protein
MKSPVTQTVLLAVCVAVIGVIDYQSGPDIGFSLFYLAPIVWSAWYMDGATAIGLAVLASGFWIGADVMWHGFNGISAWNGFTRLGIYIGMAWSVAHLRHDRRDLQALNARLQHLLEQEQQLARTDSLTGLPNRRLFVDELRRAIARSRRNGAPLAVAFLDLEHLKQLNDRHGHAAGDAVIGRVADVLGRHVRGNDMAARLGGDEFGVLLDACTQDTARSTMERLLEQLRAMLIETSPVTIGVSIGVACFDAPPQAAETIIDHADAAMYCAKGKGAHEIYIAHYPAGSEEPGPP